MPSKSGECCKSPSVQKPQAIMVDGQRYTCEKCRKGHRTGTCTHLVDDEGNPSLLQKTNRAGRPNTTSKCRCPSSDRCTCVRTWYLVVRIPKSEIEPGKESEHNCRIVGTVVRPLREDGKNRSFGGSLIASSAGSSGHQCNCGDTCACTYCPQHPENQATHDHNQFLANQNRPMGSLPHPDQQLVESASQNCGGTAEVIYACTSDSSAAGQEAMLSTIPLNDQNYHYQVYSGQYSRGGCGSSCRCPGCITWRAVPSVKQQLALGGCPHEDCPPKCNCRGCWSHRERGGSVEFPILSLEDFFSTQADDQATNTMAVPTISPNLINNLDHVTLEPQVPIAYQPYNPNGYSPPVEQQTPYTPVTQLSPHRFHKPYLHHASHASAPIQDSFEFPTVDPVPAFASASLAFVPQSIKEASR